MKRVIFAVLACTAALVPLAAAAQDAGAPDAQSHADAAIEAETSAPIRPDAEVPEPPTAVLGEQDRHPLVKDVSALLNPPFGWAREPGDPLESAELAQIPGAEGILSLVWTPSSEVVPVRPRYAESARLQLICASAPSDDWAPNMESLVFERLNVIAREELNKHMLVGAFNPSAPNESGAVFWQNFTLRGSPGAARKEGAVRVLEVDQLGARDVVLGEGRHIIGFSSEPDRVVVCSIACVEPIGRRFGRCSATLGSFRLDGALAPEPLPSTMGTMILGVRRRPLALVGAAIGLFVSLLGALMVLRGLMLRNAGARPLGAR